jgi:hypothetical protein
MTKKEYTKPVIIEMCGNTAMAGGCSGGAKVTYIPPCITGDENRKSCVTGVNDGFDCRNGSGALE